MKITNVEFWDSNESTDGGMEISWIDSRYGFGTVVLYKKNHKFYADSEYMEKKFVTELLQKLGDQIIIIG